MVSAIAMCPTYVLLYQNSSGSASQDTMMNRFAIQEAATWSVFAQDNPGLCLPYSRLCPQPCQRSVTRRERSSLHEKSGFWTKRQVLIFRTTFRFLLSGSLVLCLCIPQVSVTKPTRWKDFLGSSKARRIHVTAESFDSGHCFLWNLWSAHMCILTGERIDEFTLEGKWRTHTHRMQSNSPKTDAKTKT